MRKKMSDTDLERGVESRRGERMQRSMEQKQADKEKEREKRIQNYYKNSDDKFKITPENRPYYIPLPDDWRNHGHTNVAHIEKGLEKMIGKLEKDGFFIYNEPDKTKRSIVIGPYGTELKNIRVVDKKEEEVDDDEIETKF